MSTDKNIHIENMNSRRYIVVTPCRNEEKNIPNLVQSITAQTIRPVLWVIVDDGSTDRTSEIVKIRDITNLHVTKDIRNEGN